MRSSPLFISHRLYIFPEASSKKQSSLDQATERSEANEMMRKKLSVTLGNTNFFKHKILFSTTYKIFFSSLFIFFERSWDRKIVYSITGRNFSTVVRDFCWKVFFIFGAQCEIKLEPFCSRWHQFEQNSLLEKRFLCFFFTPIVLLCLSLFPFGSFMFTRRNLAFKRFQWTKIVKKIN